MYRENDYNDYSDKYSKQYSDVSMNCLIDLHLHLDGSLSLDTVKELAELENIDLPYSDKEIIKKLSVSEKCKDLNEYLEKFDFPLMLLQSRETISTAVYNLQEELKSQGLIYAEIRFAPQLHTKRGLTQREVVEAAIDGLNRSQFKANLIVCCMRGSDNVYENIQTVNTAAEFLGKGVCAADLAGAEALYKTDNFKNIFRLASELNIPFTVHAGEADGPESIKTALSFGASRIGHGVRSVEDELLVKHLARTGITLELCPKSNLDTNIYSDICEYPLKTFIESGVHVTINTDNMTVSGVTLRQQLQLIAKTFCLSDSDIKKILLNAADASFAGVQTKEWLRNMINQEIM